jgi:hypothetical protein
MTKGIREYTDARFAIGLAAFQAAEVTGAAFRRGVMEDTVAKFGISVASAATHYNHSLKMAKTEAPASVEGLGRSDDKKGGRPVLNPVTVIKAKSGEVVMEGLSRGAATILIAKAAAKRGVAKLAIKQDVDAAAAKAAAKAAAEADAMVAA